MIQFRDEGGVDPGLGEGIVQLVECSDQGLRDESSAVTTPVPGRVRIVVGRGVRPLRSR